MSWRARWVELLLRMMVKRRLPPDVDLVAMRRHYEEIDLAKFTVPPDVRRTPVDVGGVRGEWVEVPQSRPDRVLLYLHGGGFALRLPNLYARFAARLCRELGARALLVDYRLAPEHPHPAGDRRLPRRVPRAARTRHPGDAISCWAATRRAAT